MPNGRPSPSPFKNAVDMSKLSKDHLLLATFCKISCFPSLLKVGASFGTVEMSGSSKPKITNLAFGRYSFDPGNGGFHVRIHRQRMIRFGGSDPFASLFTVPCSSQAPTSLALTCLNSWWTWSFKFLHWTSTRCFFADLPIKWIQQDLFLPLLHYEECLLGLVCFFQSQIPGSWGSLTTSSPNTHTQGIIILVTGNWNTGKELEGISSSCLGVSPSTLTGWRWDLLFGFFICSEIFCGCYGRSICWNIIRRWNIGESMEVWSLGRDSLINYPTLRIFWQNLVLLSDAGRKCCGLARMRYPPFHGSTIPLSFVPPWWPVLDHAIYLLLLGDSPEVFSNIVPNLQFQNQLRLDGSFSVELDDMHYRSAWMKARLACSRRIKLSRKWTPSGVSLSARACAPTPLSEVSDAGKFRAFPRRACSGVKPLAQDNEFLAAKTWRRHLWKSLTSLMGPSQSIRVSISLAILPWISALPICQWLFCRCRDHPYVFPLKVLIP